MEQTLVWAFMEPLLPPKTSAGDVVPLEEGWPVELLDGKPSAVSAGVVLPDPAGCDSVATAHVAWPQPMVELSVLRAHPHPST